MHSHFSVCLVSLTDKGFETDGLCRTCSQCPSIQCIKNSSSSGGGGVNPGVIAGPVVAVLLIASLGLFWWLRKKKVGLPLVPTMAHLTVLRSATSLDWKSSPPEPERQNQ